MTMMIVEIIEKYIKSDSQSRQQIEREVGLSRSTLNSVLDFISECAVLAVRQKDKLFIEKGLYANVVEGCRQDFRDNIVQILTLKMYKGFLILSFLVVKIVNGQG